jgi:hypothetical protein
MILVWSGCGLSPLAKRSAAFGNAATIVVRDSSNAYETVERATYDAAVGALVLDFESTGFDRTKIKPFLSAYDLDVRQQILRGLQSYADGLAEVAGDRALAPVDEQGKVLSEALVKLSANGDLKSVLPGVTEAEAKGLATAVDTLAKVLIERKRRKQLPTIIARMQPVLERICDLLDKDLGMKPLNGHAGHGLRNELWNQYDNLIGNETDYIFANKSRFTPSEKAAEIARLPQMVAKQQSADSALASTQEAARQLVSTHRVLLAPQSEGTFRSRLHELIEDGERIAAFYSSLKAQ